MKGVFVLILGLAGLTACVPMKKYNELLEREKACSEELTDFKTRALDSEALSAELKAQTDLLNASISQLKEDTTILGSEYRLQNARYAQLKDINASLEENYNKLRQSGASETAALQMRLKNKEIELQEKEDRLLILEQELMAKEHLLVERERRVNELESKIKEQERATRELKDKVALALKGFENKGLTVEERNGKIYVSLEAKLLFKSGATEVESEGEKALIDLAKVLENEKDLEIIVEGHTDTDKMSSAKHPTNNWELSVLRSTSVIEIMMANSSIDPKQLMAAGRSEFIPVDELDKAKNRRIEIIISPNLNELFEIIGQ